MIRTFYTASVYNFRKLPDIVKFFSRRLMKLSRILEIESGYTIYIKGDSCYVQKELGLFMLTASDYRSINRYNIDFILNPDEVYLLHTHPFANYPVPSVLDIETADRFRDYYSCKVTCIVIGRKGYCFY